MIHHLLSPPSQRVYVGPAQGDTIE
jgi:hypothetical protein